MKTNDEKERIVYARPEAEEVEVSIEGLCGFESTGEGEHEDW